MQLFGLPSAQSSALRVDDIISSNVTDEALARVASLEEIELNVATDDPSSAVTNEASEWNTKKLNKKYSEHKLKRRNSWKESRNPHFSLIIMPVI